MPVFTIETPSGKRLKIEAPDEATAMQGAQDFEEGRAQVETAPPAPQAAPPAPSAGTGEDVLRSAGTGLRQGVEGLGGMFGDAAKMQGDIAGWAAGKLGAGEDTQASVSKWGRLVNPFLGAPTTEEIQSATKPVIGENYEPQTVAGEYARTTGQFAPGALAGPGGLMRKAAMTAVPALASETAGQLTKGTAAEPYARGAAALAGGVAAAGRNVPRRQPPTPTVEDLTTEARTLYQQADQAGIVVPAQRFDRVAQNVEMAAGRINRDLRPNTAGIVDDITALRGRDISLQELDELRQVVGQSMNRAQPQDVRTLERIRNVIDGFADNARPADITGDVRGFEYIRQARAIWSRRAKTEALNEVVERARNQATGFENGLVIQMRSLANNRNRMRSFSREEQAMIRQVVRRGSVHGILRAVGMLAPNSTFGGLVAGGATVGSGIIPGALLAGTGMAARAGAGALTHRNFDRLYHTAASGTAPQRGPAQLNVEALRRSLLAAESGENSARSNTSVR